jgi:hypothetical protein
MEHRVYRVHIRLSIHSSELGPSTPYPARECCSPPLWVQGGRYTHVGVGGGERTQSDDGTDTLVYFRYTLIPLRQLTCSCEDIEKGFDKCYE